MPKHAIACALVALVAACAGKHPPAPEPVAPVEAPRPVRVALVLGGGGARGFAHVGVIRVLEQEKIPIDMIVGTSAGSLIGALYSDHPDSFTLESVAWTIEKADVFDPTFFGAARGPLSGEALEKFVGRKVSAATIEGLALPFVAVAADLMTGEEVLFDHGPVGRAVRASSAIPGVFRPVEIDGRTLVDGGIVDPVPASVARSRGADVVIAVDITRELPADEPGNLATISLRSIAILSRELARAKAREADVVLYPKVGPTSPFDFASKQQLMAAGVEAARAALPQIREAIARRGRER